MSNVLLNTSALLTGLLGTAISYAACMYPIPNQLRFLNLAEVNVLNISTEEPSSSGGHQIDLIPLGRDTGYITSRLDTGFATHASAKAAAESLVNAANRCTNSFCLHMLPNRMALVNVRTLQEILVQKTPAAGKQPAYYTLSIKLVPGAGSPETRYLSSPIDRVSFAASQELLESVQAFSRECH